MHWLLFYEYVPDYLERRRAHRSAHFDHAKPYLDRGELILGGAFADPADGAVLLFSADGPEAAEGFAEDDPYVREGLVTDWRIREWTTVVGPDAASPVPGTG
ncbi:MAG: YciI-like protein [Halobacteriales archaeon]|nr:YciI-like protein [Halobacteriales archaeon]